jgi:serine/threonine-protein kinase
MFLDEARLAALIHHPNVVSITEVGASDRGYYLVMDYIEGDTLARLMTDCAEVGRVVPIGVGLRIVIDTLTGLHAAHDLHDEQGHPTGLVHRDVSPQNVLVGLDGISRISDFGVARAASRLAGTRVGQLKGKIAYMAPEQAAGDELLDRRADVFAAGVVLWELLTGRRLFRASNDAATLSRVVTEKIEPPIRYVEGLDGRISDICMKALERPLSRRIASAAQFAEMLESAAARAGVLGSGRDVAGYMQTVMGEEVARQREAVRRWVSETEPKVEESESDAAWRTTGSQPRQERLSSGFERGVSVEKSSSSSRTRPVFLRPVPDSDPHELTLVAGRPRLRPIAAAAAGLALIGLGIIGWLSAARSQRIEAARLEHVAEPLPWVGRASTTVKRVLQRGALTTGIGAEDSASQVATENVEHLAVVPPSASARPTRPVTSASPAGRSSAAAGVTDVDLSNPYR